MNFDESSFNRLNFRTFHQPPPRPIFLIAGVYKSLLGARCLLIKLLLQIDLITSKGIKIHEIVHVNGFHRCVGLEILGIF